MLNLYQRGDTIIEVLLAITVFSMVSIGSMTIMNQGTNSAQRALEITQVRQQVDAQTEALRAAQQAASSAVNPDITAWKTITSHINTNHFTDNDRCPTGEADGLTGSFVMNPMTVTKLTASDWLKDINSSNAPPYAQLKFADEDTANAYGLWIEREWQESAGATPDAYNFAVRACWYSAGLDHPSQIETLVRLYEPL